MGSGSGPIGRGGRIDARFFDDAPTVARAEQGLRRLLPGLAGARVERAWGGPIDVSSDQLPFFGTVPGTRIHYGAGYCGQRRRPELARRADPRLARPRRRRRVVAPAARADRLPPRLPPEPFRYARRRARAPGDPRRRGGGRGRRPGRSGSRAASPRSRASSACGSARADAARRARPRARRGLPARALERPPRPHARPAGGDGGGVLHGGRDLGAGRRRPLARRGGRLEVHRRERRRSSSPTSSCSARPTSRAPLSVFYPIARGLAPVLVLRRRRARARRGDARRPRRSASAPSAPGILLVRGRRPDRAATLFGLAIAATIAGYTLIDNTGVTLADPLAYLEAVMIGPALVTAAVVAVRQGTPALRAGFRRETLLIAPLTLRAVRAHAVRAAPRPGRAGRRRARDERRSFVTAPRGGRC